MRPEPNQIKTTLWASACGVCIRISIAALCIYASLIARLNAQTISQAITLQPGWNAIFIELDPAPADTASVFNNVPIESVWMWNEKYGAPQFIQDPAQLKPDQPEWLKYFPPGAVSNNLTNMQSVIGGKAYLVKLSGTQSAVLTIKGRPRVRAINWIPNTYSLVGFYLDPGQSISFQNFFAPSTAHNNQPMYKMTPAGTWQQIANPAGEQMQAGQAYWVYTNGPSTYMGPLDLGFDLFPAFDFGSNLDQLRFTIANKSTASRNVQVTKLPSDPPSDSQGPALAGDVPLSYLQRNLNQATKQYIDLTSPLGVSLGSSQSNEVELAVRRNDMNAFSLPAGATSALYEAVLEVKDGAGMRYRIPVTSLGTSNNGTASLRRKLTGGANLLSGLWVGSVSLDAVNEPRNSNNPNLTRPSGGNFQFRVLLHIDTNNKARLLQSALIMFREAELGPLQGSPPSRPVITPGRFVIITSDSLLSLKLPDGITPLYTGAGLRDGVEVGRRISSANFSFSTPQLMTGVLTSSATVLSCNLSIPFNDRLNPFLHVYHPDHDNKDRQFQPYTSEGTETFTIGRSLTMTFGQNSLTNLVEAGFGTRVLDGIYEETITGLHKAPLKVHGTFQLSRVLDVGVLNDGR